MQKTKHHGVQAIVSRMAGFCLGLLCLVFALPLAAYIYLGSFIRLIGDDYCYAAVLRQFGFWMTQWQSYIAIVTYNGNRYSLNLFSTLVDLFGPKANSVLPFLAILLWLCGLAWSWRNGTRLVGIHALPLSWLLTAEVLVFFTLVQAPDLDQAFYWRTGMLTYLAPVITGSTLLGLILWQANQPRAKLTLLVSIFMLALISAGFSEVGAVAHITGLACLLVWSVYETWRRGRTVPQNSTPSARLIAPAGVALAGSLAALLLLALSPSTRLNLQTMPSPAPLFSTVQIALYSARIFIVSVTIKRMILPNLLLFCFTMAGSALMAAWATRSGKPHPTVSVSRWLLALAGIVTTCLLIVIACMFPNAYTQSGYPELRALIIPRFVLVASIAGSGWLTGWFFYSQLCKRPRFISHASGLLAALILFIASVFPITSARPILSRVPLFTKWAYLWDQRDQQIRHASGNNLGSVQVLELDHIISGVSELKVGGWYTQCANQYYGIQVLPDLPGWDQNNSP